MRVLGPLLRRAALLSPTTAQRRRASAPLSRAPPADAQPPTPSPLPPPADAQHHHHTPSSPGLKEAPALQGSQKPAGQHPPPSGRPRGGSAKPRGGKQGSGLLGHLIRYRRAVLRDCKAGDVKGCVRRVFEMMSPQKCGPDHPDLNVAVCAAMALCNKAGEPHRALLIAKRCAFRLDDITFGALLHALGTAGKIDDMLRTLQMRVANRPVFSLTAIALQHALSSAPHRSDAFALCSSLSESWPRHASDASPAYVSGAIRNFARLTLINDAMRLVASQSPHYPPHEDVLLALANGFALSHRPLSALHVLDMAEAMGVPHTPALVSAALGSFSCAKQAFDEMHRGDGGGGGGGGGGGVESPAVRPASASDAILGVVARFQGMGQPVYTAAMHALNRLQLHAGVGSLFWQLEALGLEPCQACHTLYLTSLTQLGRHGDATRHASLAVSPSGYAVRPDPRLITAIDTARIAAGEAPLPLPHSTSTSTPTTGGLRHLTQRMGACARRGDVEGVLSIFGAMERGEGGAPLPDAAAVQVAARACREAGDYGSAADALRAAACRTPLDAPLLLEVAKLCLASGDWALLWDLLQGGGGGMRWGEGSIPFVMAFVAQATGGHREALRIFDVAEAAGLRVTGEDFTRTALEVCAEHGVWDAALRIFETSEAAAPDLAHSVVRACGSERLDEACRLLESLEGSPLLSWQCGVELVECCDDAGQLAWGLDVLRCVDWAEVPQGHSVPAALMKLAVLRQDLRVVRQAAVLYAGVPTLMMQAVLALPPGQHDVGSLLSLLAGFDASGEPLPGGAPLSKHLGQRGAASQGLRPREEFASRRVRPTGR